MIGRRVLLLGGLACGAAGTLRAAPFRRLTSPFMIPVGTTASSVQLPAGLFTSPDGRYPSFWVVNPNACFVRFAGFSDANAASEVVTPTTGWDFAPGFEAVFGTQYPTYVSALAYDTPLYPLANVTKFVPLELAYGYGE